MRVAAALCCSLVLGCGPDEPQISIVLDLPAESRTSYPFGAAGVDTLRLSVARAGDDSDLLSSVAAADAAPSLGSIPFGRDLVLHLYGEESGADVAYGRSCSFDFADDQSGPESIHLYFSRVVRWGDGPAPVADRIGGHAFSRQNGTVVLAGGAANARLELFNPRAGELRVIEEAPATLDRSGGVLAELGSDGAIIIGGVDGTGAPVDTIELLPDLRDSLSGALAVRGHDAAALVSGKVLVAGGESHDGSAFALTADAWEIELGDGATLSPPSATGSLAAPRKLHTLTRLSDEVGAAVLVAGGLDAADQPVSSAEVYRPLARAFETVSGTIRRWDHRAVRLPGGAVLLVGGLTSDGITAPEPARDLELFDPIGGTFAVAGVLPTGAPVSEFTLTPLPDGRVLLAGGRNSAGDAVANSYIIRFDVINGLVDVVQTDSLATARAGHSASLVCDGTVLVSGGQDGGNPTSERYNPPDTDRR